MARVLYVGGGYIRHVLFDLVENRLIVRGDIEKFSMGLFNKMESRREVQITTLSKQNCSSLSRAVCYIVYILREKHFLKNCDISLISGLK